MDSVRNWSTADFTSPTKARPTAVIVLNTPLVHDRLFTQIWSNSSVKMCADGGTNRLYDSYGQTARTDHFIPEFIVGDLDSLRPDVRQFYEAKGTVIDHKPSQDSTDLGKCVDCLEDTERAEATMYNRPPSKYQLVILGGLSGRLDQTIHTLHAITERRLGDNPREGTWVVGRESIACVLGPGTHRLEIPLDQFGPTCGILPLGEEARVTTRGLRWNLEEGSWAHPTSMAKGVSTSNHLTGEFVEITTDVPIIFTAEVREVVP